jgi:TRAP-type C4-dicarboxylate transport system permease large subunit
MSRGFTAAILSFGAILTPIIPPPVEAAMYAGCSILRVPLGEYTRASIPLFLAVAGVALLPILIPDAVLFVPDLLFGPA